VILGPIGWYRDPYGVHEDRYFSQGFPTKLVRDRGVEAYDPPPDGVLPKVLVPAALGARAAGKNGADLRRAGEEPAHPPHACRGAMPAQFDIFGFMSRR
jgi:hypothetical protein